MADFVNSVDMDGLAADISAIIELLNNGAVAAQGFAEWIGRISGLQNIGGSIIGAFDSNGDGKLSAFGGALTVNSTVKASDKLVDNTEKRLSLERQIAEIKANPMNVLGQAEIRQLEGQIKGLQETATKTASTIIQDTLNNVPLKYPSAAPTFAGSSTATGGKSTVNVDTSTGDAIWEYDENTSISGSPFILKLQEMDDTDQPVGIPEVKFTGTIDNLEVVDQSDNDSSTSVVTIEVVNAFTLRTSSHGGVLSDVDQKARSARLNPGAPADRFCERIPGLRDKTIRWPNW